MDQRRGSLSARRRLRRQDSAWGARRFPSFSRSAAIRCGSASFESLNRNVTCPPILPRRRRRGGRRHVSRTGPRGQPESASRTPCTWSPAHRSPAAKSNRYRVTAEPRTHQGLRIWMVYEAESGAVIAKKLDEIEAQALCDQFNGGKVKCDGE
jgi:hypothetical protein